MLQSLCEKLRNIPLHLTFLTRRAPKAAAARARFPAEND
jgi:hypothetical protein